MSVRRAAPLLSCALAAALIAGPPAPRAPAAVAPATDQETPACEPAAGPDGVAEAAIPFELYDNHLYLPATVEGAGPLAFILDTGASVTAVDWGVAADLDLPLRDPGESRGAGAGAMRNARLPGVSVRVGGVDASGTAPLAMPLDSVIGPFTGRTAPGVVGFPFFRERVIEVNFDARCVWVHDPAAFRYRGDGVVVPLEVREGWAHVDAVMGLADGREVEADLMVDTGSKLTLVVTTGFVRRERLLSSFPERATGSVGAGVGGEARFQLARLPELALDTLVHRNAVVGLSAGPGLDTRRFDGILGTEFLRRFRVFFDYPGGRMILEPGAGRDDPERFDMSGLVLVAPQDADGNRPIRVHRVGRGTPAAYAGIREGDRVLSIDGVSPPELRLHEARRLLRGEPGTVRTVRVARDGRELTYVFSLEPLI